MHVPESVGHYYVSEVPLELSNQDGLDLVAPADAASVPVAIDAAAKPGDVMTLYNFGPAPVHFRVGGAGDLATRASTPVPAGEKEIFLLPMAGKAEFVSLLGRGGTASCTLNFYRRGT